MIESIDRGPYQRVERAATVVWQVHKAGSR